MITVGNIILVGPMGAGKTTLGKKLAQHLAIPFVDVDEEIEKKLGVDITTIFDTEGEAGFRQREALIFKSLLNEYKNAVIATGGGCVLCEANRRLMVQERLVVHIDVSITTQHKRLQSDKKRPILQTPDLPAKLHELRTERHNIYQSVADIYALVDNGNVRRFIKKVEKAFQH